MDRRKRLTNYDLELLEKKAIFEARNSFFAYRRYIHPRLKVNWFVYDLSKHLEQFYIDLVEGKRPKLAISAPPQHGKSSAIVDFMTWVAGKDPSLRHIYTSFSDRLGVRTNLACQRIFDSARFKVCFPDTIIPSNGSSNPFKARRNSELIEFIDKDGSIRNTTVKGSITGESLDCMPAGTMITTDKGQVDIKNLENYSFAGYNILSYNHMTGEFSYEKISNFKRLARDGIYRFTTKSGRVFECTGDHRIYKKGIGYTKAHNLSKGDFVLRLLSETISENSSRSEKMAGFWCSQEILFEKVSIGSQANCDESCETLQRLRGRIAKTMGSSLQKVFDYFSWQTGNSISNRRKNLRNLPNKIFEKKKKILLFNLRRYCAFNGYERAVKSKMEQWIKRSKIFRIFDESIQSDKAIYSGKRQLLLRSLQSIKCKVGSSSHRWVASKSCFDKLNNFVHLSPCGNAQDDERKWRTIEDEITCIQKIDCQTIVYDITVNKNHNFFANGILVHNCGYIDDPIKGREHANSLTIRDSVWDWLTDDFMTRFSDEAGMLFIMTRWHIDDPLSRLEKEVGDSLKTVNYPAIATEDEKYRRKGEPLLPELKSIEFLNERKIILPNPSWESLYQGSPKQLTGNIIPTDSFRRYTILPRIEYRTIYVDTAQKTSERNDYSVFECWGKGFDGNLYLIDLHRGKWTAPELKKTAKDFWIKHLHFDYDGFGQLREMKVEDKSSGTGLIQEIAADKTGDVIIPISGIERTKDKYTRVLDIVPTIDSGYVYIPEEAPWVSDFIKECDEFTADDSHMFDDQIDPMCDAITDMGNMSSLNIWAQLGKS